MKKRILMLLAAACLMMNLLPMGALAEETEETVETVEETEAADPDAKSGSCGDGLTWTLEGNTLTISGSGEMDDGAPWDAHKKKIETVILTGGVTKIGANAFAGYDRLESVDFGNALVEIGARAFYGCPDLTVIHLPATFRTFGEECFRDCGALQKVYCDGGMPRFNSSCLWTGNYISVFYPTNNIWPQEPVNQLVNNFGGRLGIMMGNYDESVLADVEEPARQETEPEETEPEKTEPPTEEPTEAPTEAPATEPVAETEAVAAVVVTEAPTEEPTAAATEPEEEPTQAQTEPDELEEVVRKVGGDGWIGMVLIAGVLTFLIAGALIFRAATKKGGRYNR